jgi:hypothetical protein
MTMRHVNRSRVKRRVAGLFLLAPLGMLPQAWAVPRTWEAGTGNWSTAANWSPSGMPGAGDDASINIDSGNLTITYDYTGSAVTLNSLNISAFSPTGGQVLFSMPANNLTAITENISGSAGNSTTFNQSGGTNAIAANGQLILGQTVNSQGNYNLGGIGVISAGLASEIIGNLGIGVFSQNGNSNIAGKLTLGAAAASSGTYSLSAGNLTVIGNETIASLGTGTLTQVGGINTVGTTSVPATLTLGDLAGSNGTYTLNMSASLVVHGTQVVGNLGAGNLTLFSGAATIGTSTAPGNLEAGLGGGSTGIISLANGTTLTVNGNITIAGTGTGTLTQTGGSMSASGNEFVGAFSGGNGTVTQSGGSNADNGGMTIGNAAGSVGTYNLSGNATINDGNIVIGMDGNGSFNQTGGSVAAAGSGPSALILGADPTGHGTYILSAGSLTIAGQEETIGGFHGGTGIFQQSGGNNQAGDLAINAGGSYTLSAGNLTSNSVEEINAGTFTQTGGSNNLSNQLIVGGLGAASYSLSGGFLSIGTLGFEDIGGGTDGGAIFSPADKFTQTGGANNDNGDLEVGVNGATGTYSLSNGSLTVGISPTNFVEANIGVSGGTGIFNQSSGSVSFNGSLNIGTGGGNSNGSYTLSGGQLNVEKYGTTAQGFVTVGGSNGDVGTFNQTGGTVLVGDYLHQAFELHLGDGPGGSGTYSLGGSGSLIIAGNEIVGNAGTGTFTQTGGSNQIRRMSDNSAGELIVGAAAGGTGTYNLGGNAILTVENDEIVGDMGTGAFIQTGGNNNVAGRVRIGDSGGNGTYTISAGLLSVGLVELGGASGAGILTVTGSGVVDVAGSLLTNGNPATTINLNGGTINTFDFATSLPSQFQWTTGTLNLTASESSDSEYQGLFGVAFTLTTGQTLGVLGTETLGGGLYPFTLTLDPGSTHNVSVELDVDPGGVLTQNPGSILYAAAILQNGGIINGTVQSQGNFVYTTGPFNGRLLNQGRFIFFNSTSFTAGNGIENDATIEIDSGQTIVANGQGFDNLGTFTLAGGTLSGSGPAVNDFGGNMTAYGFVNSAFTNNGRLTVDGTLRFNGGATNSGIIQGDGTVVGNLTNAAGGLIQPSNLPTSSGGGDDPLAFTAFGGNSAGASIQIGADLQINISNAWTNAGVVALGGNTPGSSALLGGGSITNTGTIEGAGIVGASIANTSGIVRAQGGELDLAGASLSNPAGGQFQAATGGTLLCDSGLSVNAGIIALEGGTFDNNAKPITNSGTISGSGTFSSGALTISSTGFLVLSDADSAVYGTVTSALGGNIKILSNTTTFYGQVTNNGTIKVTSGVARFLGNGPSLTVGGTYISDPSDNYITGLNITSSGLVTGGSGDRFFLTAGASSTNSGTFTNGGLLDSSENITNSGTFTQSGPQIWSPGTTFTNTAGTANFLSDAGAPVALNLTIDANAGAVNLTGQQHLQALSISAGGAASFTATPLVVGPGNRNPNASTSEVDTLAIAGGAAPTGTLNLNNNALIILNGGAAARDAVEADIAYARNGGLWNRPGITSSVSQAAFAATHFDSDTLAVALNSDLPTPYTTFNGNPVGPNDVLVAFTYGGDGDLNGVINGNDYFLIDRGFLNHYTGYVNGDFNYDGIVNGNDYFIIDSNFIDQSGQLAAPEVLAHAAEFGPEYLAKFSAGELTAIGVPEPGSLVLLVLGAALTWPCRRRGAARLIFERTS